jgi:heparosan-N-sulfate-glucuronate 5-epimerase
MSAAARKFRSLMEYFGIRSSSYYHSDARANYDPDDPIAYYLDHTLRAHFPGPRDSDGVLLYSRSGHTGYHPVLNALYALGHCDLFRLHGEESNRDECLKIADWFLNTQDDRGLWLTPFPQKTFGLKENFVSAMAQGMGISVLVRAHRLTDRHEYVEAARKALGIFHVDVADGGVQSTTDGRIFYEEFPTDPPHHVLNGFIYAMWGLYDLVRLENDDNARVLWEDGLATLVEWLPQFDMGHWSLYHIGAGMANPATIAYHKLHIEQLKVMFAITGLAVFEQYATRWERYLAARWNALRTLPRKLAWNVFRGM